MKITKENMAQLIRGGAMEVTCGKCGAVMTVDATGNVACPGCGKPFGAGDRFTVKKDLQFGTRQ